MEQTISFVTSEISKIRTGRANTGIFNNILVNYYDNDTPLNQIANIAALDAITISIQPFDKTVIDEIERAILESDLGFNPSNNGNSIMITFPPLSSERRQELVKVSSKIVEDGRISVRNIRREIIQSSKRVQEEQNISEDNMKNFLDDIQVVTDSFINKLNSLQKEKELDFDIEIDGGINFDNAKLAIEAGANILVSGTTIFKKNNGDIKRNIELLKSK